MSYFLHIILPPKALLCYYLTVSWRSSMEVLELREKEDILIQSAITEFPL